MLVNIVIYGPMHKVVNCTNQGDVSSRMEIDPYQVWLCLNCAVGIHKSIRCPLKSSCQICNLHYHSSLHKPETKLKAQTNAKSVAMTSSTDTGPLIQCDGAIPHSVINQKSHLIAYFAKFPHNCA